MTRFYVSITSANKYFGNFCFYFWKSHLYSDIFGATTDMKELVITEEDDDDGKT